MLTGLQRAAFPLAIAQTLAWTSLYYIFPALTPAWQGALGWSKTELLGAFTLALVVSAIAAPLAVCRINGAQRSDTALALNYP